MSGAGSGNGSQENRIPSSFPSSSPTFWNEAAKLLVDQDGSSAAETPDGGNSSRADHAYPSKRRRTRFSPSPPLAKVELDEPGMQANEEDERSAGTTLSYLPNRTDPFADLEAHSYLAGAEYAPNKFGDIGDYMRKKEIKVQTQNRDIAMADPAAANLPQIFKDLSFYINGNTHPPMEELRKMILQRGGLVRPVLRSKGYVKYIIAPMLTQMKFKQFQHYKVVREGWILDSCKEGKLLDWTKWKLAIQGGWEEEGRKGLEGFFRGEPSQRAKRERESDEEEDGEEIEEEERMETAPILPVTKPRSENPVPISDPPPAPTKTDDSPVISAPNRPAPLETVKPPTLSVAHLSPAKASPNRKEVWAPKKAESQWEFYATKDSNEDAARLLKDQEWRLKNTAERGNEGGFIDGYYQNSR